jgi:hypothetical protein
MADFSIGIIIEKRTSTYLKKIIQKRKINEKWEKL